MMRRTKNEECRKRASQCIAQGALTNSKRPESFIYGVYPTHIARMDGCYAWDVDGNRYIDFLCSLGVNLVGAANPKINDAIIRQLKKGTSFSLGSELEIEFAERIKGVFPYIERMKIVKSGTEGCMAAIRMARAFTGKKMVYSEGYHGWSDEFVSLTPPAMGVNKESFVDISVLGTGALPFAAAVIVEPIITDISEVRLENLRRIRKFCDESGAVLIFDETITAYRFPGLSVANWCGVRPDISVMGKAVGGGLPLTIVGGKKEILETDYFVSSTFAGDTTAIAAGIALLDLLHSDVSMDKFWGDGKRFMEQFNAINPDIIRMVGYPTRGIFNSRNEETKALFMQECVKAGLLFHPTSWFWNYKHADETFDVLKICEAVINRINNKQVLLEGKLPAKPYSQKVRDT